MAREPRVDVPRSGINGSGSLLLLPRTCRCARVLGRSQTSHETPAEGAREWVGSSTACGSTGLFARTYARLAYATNWPKVWRASLAWLLLKWCLR